MITPVKPMSEPTRQIDPAGDDDECNADGKDAEHGDVARKVAGVAELRKSWLDAYSPRHISTRATAFRVHVCKWLMEASPILRLPIRLAIEAC